MLVTRQPVDGDELFVEAARVRSGCPALLRAKRESVLVLARHAPALGDVLPRLTHRLEREELGKSRVREAPPELRVVFGRVVADVGPRVHERRAAHRLDAAGDEEVAVTGSDRVRRRDHRGQSRSAKTIHRHPGDGLRQAREQDRHARDVAVVLARLVGGAEVDVLDLRRVHSRARNRLGDHRRGEIVRPDVSQSTAPAPDRRAHSGEDDGAAHDSTNSTRTGCSYVPVSSARRSNSSTACRPSSP